MSGEVQVRHPMGPDSRVIIDPRRSFGRPIDGPTGVPTYSLWGPWQAGDSVEAVAEWFDAPAQAVLDAIDYEELPHATREMHEREVQDDVRKVWEAYWARIIRQRRRTVRRLQQRLRMLDRRALAGWLGKHARRRRANTRRELAAARRALKEARESDK